MEPRFSPNALTVLERRYLRKEAGKVVETPGELLRRVARNIAQVELKHGATEADVARLSEEFYTLMATLEFMPNSPTLMNAGRDLQQLAACFVLPVGDSLGEIFEAVKHAALIHQSGGGTGFSFSRLRPKHDAVRTTGGVASGPVSFMKVFNTATEAVKQGGTRRGANMGILRVDHPDIRDFITCKQDGAEITNFNISVGITDSFMAAVRAGAEFPLVNPRDGSQAGTVMAAELMDLIVDMAWKNGEPGVVFLDRLNADNPTPALGDIESTNPCGEQPLLPYEACNLGSLNLALLVKDGSYGPTVDYAKLAQRVKQAVHFLDNVIDASRYPLEEISRMVGLNRKIGLGVMGFADLLLRLGISYRSEQAVSLAEELMAAIHGVAREASAELAAQRGPFPSFPQSTYRDGRPLRNATTTTIAPTGTISMLCGCSSGIEPLFALAFQRNVLDNDRLLEVNPVFFEAAKARGFHSEALIQAVSRTGSCAGLSGVPVDVQQVFVTAHDIEPEWHVRIQAAFQRHTDNAVSKTVNFPHSATREDVAKVYWLAYELGCKGVTIYRDGSREAQVLSVPARSEGGGEVAAAALTVVRPRPRPLESETRGITKKFKIGGCGKLFVTVNSDDFGLCEVFTNTGEEGCQPLSEAVSRLVSIALRSGVEVESVVNQLKGIKCVGCIVDQPETRVLSCPDAIGKAIEKYVNGVNRFDLSVFGGPRSVIPCQEPGCTGYMVHADGCYTCVICGFSRCG